MKCVPTVPTLFQSSLVSFHVLRYANHERLTSDEYVSFSCVHYIQNRGGAPPPNAIYSTTSSSIVVNADALATMQTTRKRPLSLVRDAPQQQTGLSEPLLGRTTQSDAIKPDNVVNLHGDRSNIAILFFLYLLQGIPIGLSAAIPMLLQNRGASYKEQAEFSFAFWPFSLKLLWAPIVDSLYSERFGRRKTWLVPIQYLLGLFMLLLSSNVESCLGETGGATPNVAYVTAIFFALNFLAATQDIAVDGWALTMLKPCNVGHASTCNSVGQTAGYFLGYVVFIALESAEFCNSYLSSEPSADGLVTLPGFLFFWGIVFLVTTTLVAIMKSERNTRDEKPDPDDEIIGDVATDAKTTNVEPKLNIRETYMLLFKIIRMPPIRTLCAILLTVKVTFAACDAVTGLKLIDAGVPKEKLALLAVPLVPLQIMLPLVISKYTTGPRPMDVYLQALPYRMVFATLLAPIVWLTPYLLSESGEVPVYYYVLLLVNYALYQVFLYSMFVAVMAFFAKISDPAVGGTYMTLLNTLCNMGGNWPTAVMLWLVDVLTWRHCRESAAAETTDPLFRWEENVCGNKTEQDVSWYCTSC